jgi:hypothetical protein
VILLLQTGHGGYDALEYHLALSVDPAAGSLAGDESRLRRRLLRSGIVYPRLLWSPDIERVAVVDLPLSFKRKGGELVIPSRNYSSGKDLEARIILLRVPEPLDAPNGLKAGITGVTNRLLRLANPRGLPLWFPVNDHPSDKASTTLRSRSPSRTRRWPPGCTQRTKTGRNGSDLCVGDAAAARQLPGRDQRGRL